MCRLFGLHAGHRAVQASFWLLNAPDSLRAQSHQAPDGTGIGVFDASGHPVVDKQAIAAWADAKFASEAKSLHGKTFVAHVRYASTGEHTLENTHPFEQDGRLYAHNGVVHGLDTLDAEIGRLNVAYPASESVESTKTLVQGQTDSERLFALITLHIRKNQGDIGAGISAAMTWVAENVPVFSVNMVLSTPTDLWALRYPATHELYVLERDPASHDSLDVASSQIRARSNELDTKRSIVVATETMDNSKHWRLLASGELIHVGQDLVVQSSFPLPAELSMPLTLADLDSTAAASQASPVQ